MITYGFSIQGKSHIERDTVCQDDNKVIKLTGKWCLGIVADGVGSAIHSEIGSKLAVESLCEFCKKHIDSEMSEEQLTEMLHNGYEYAMDRISEYVKEKKDDIAGYDTTLSAALYDGEKVIYGHAGDGGILVRLNNGKIQPITERQKGADGSSVRPLRAGASSWEFGVLKEKAASVLLVTDGLLDGVFQLVLVNLPSDLTELARGDFKKNYAYITAAEFFMNPNGVYLNKKISNANEFMRRFIVADLEEKDQNAFLKCMIQNYVKMFGKEEAEDLGKRIAKYYYAVWALKQVTDDKSVVCMMNEKANVSPQNTVYYYEPNWKWRKEQYNALLYGQPVSSAPKDDPMSQELKKTRKKLRRVLRQQV